MKTLETYYTVEGMWVAGRRKTWCSFNSVSKTLKRGQRELARLKKEYSPSYKFRLIEESKRVVA